MKIENDPIPSNWKTYYKFAIRKISDENLEISLRSRIGIFRTQLSFYRWETIDTRKVPFLMIVRLRNELINQAMADMWKEQEGILSVGEALSRAMFED